MQKERQTTPDGVKDNKSGPDSTNSDDAERRYYYDDAHGYEEYDPEENEDDED